MVAGLLIIAAGLVLFAHSPVHGHFATDVMPPMLLLGLGAGLAFPTLMQVAMSVPRRRTRGWRPGWSTPPHRSAAIGLAVLSTLAAERTEG